MKLTFKKPPNITSTPLISSTKSFISLSYFFDEEAFDKFYKFRSFAMNIRYFIRDE
jgi:hypothetical protein